MQSAVYGIVRDRGINLAGKFVIGSPWNNAPVLEGWARVHYNYLTKAWSADTFMVLPREGLRSSAMQEGATIVGCSPSRAVDQFPVPNSFLLGGGTSGFLMQVHLECCDVATQPPKQGRLLKQRHSFDSPRSRGVGTPSGHAR